MRSIREHPPPTRLRHTDVHPARSAILCDPPPHSTRGVRKLINFSSHSFDETKCGLHECCGQPRCVECRGGLALLACDRVRCTAAVATRPCLSQTSGRGVVGKDVSFHDSVSLRGVVSHTQDMIISYVV